MSLAYFAASVDDMNGNSMLNTEDTSNNINRKRRAHTRTQKMYQKENFDKIKVNSVLDKIYSNLDGDEEEDMNAFQPPPKPVSAAIEREQMSNMLPKADNAVKALGKTVGSLDEGQEFSSYQDVYGNGNTTEEYFKKMLPGYTPSSTPVHVVQASSGGNDVLMQKLNYMISLLEEQQDERTNNVTEEVVLYSFLGIFIIFIADSFVRVGKYVR